MDVSTLAVALGYTKKQIEQTKREGFKVQVEQDRSILETIGKEKIFYFLPKTESKPKDGYDEFIYTNNDWEQVGVTDIDLSAYALKSEIPTKVSQLQNDSGYLTEHQDISGKADKATTLSGYGITDAYTKSETDSLLAQKLDKTADISASIIEIINNLSDLINVEAYGATAGSAAAAMSNVTAFNDAVKAAKAQGKGILIPEKTFYLNGTVAVSGLNNTEIVNRGQIVAVPVPRATDEASAYCATFAFSDCSNLTFRVGRLTSTRTERGKAPAGGHTRVPQDGYSAGKSSNVTAMQVNRCNKLTVRDGVITNMEYAINLERKRDITAESFKTEANRGILVENLDISSTSQPFLINVTEDITIRDCRVESCPLMGTGDHHIYACDYINYIRIEDCVFSFADNYYGSALNFYNSFLSTTGHDGWSVKRAEIINTRVVGARYHRIVTANGDSVINIRGCDFQYEDTGKTPTVDLADAVSNWNTRYGTDTMDENIMHGRRTAFNIGSARCKLDITVENTVISDPLGSGQLVSGFIYPWTLSFGGCTLSLGFIASYSSATGLYNNPYLAFSGCDITVKRWLLILKTTTENNAASSPVKAYFTNCTITCTHNGATPQFEVTPMGSNENQKPTDLRILGCIVLGKPNAVMIQNKVGDTEQELSRFVMVMNSVIEGFGTFISSGMRGSAILHNNCVGGTYEA